ncbi:adenylate/guanylate cyclase domain-containing protein [Staphylococcus xylosus]|uniref:adenylate/guanylate cyclase domain-containing protein n=1 Tax=Staphylococcus xylosus TaxID=1288 RepID=UPI000F540E0F|nr:adenylate/guanylate cyclase domain-containing protein [Staphylococcus xylosus]MCQ3816726.1 adenylate/guanylate cyclase domain-containing protein [Staphylococcus xylosus]MCQ3819220.1 adenylate/guanylate cyclase domain-containing protein [Staphylococcus xylosus]RQM85569.1 adenylate/guanylate cyclase domain-containing protein [Staphylococcus xylosus]UBV36647.1 adenylate/guanylate cyclase domain-containing protein [Staphylococcus xylosus]
MKTQKREFNLEDSLERIDKVLNATLNITDSKVIPDKESLTYTSGKRVECTSIFVDLRGSSKFVESTRQNKSLGKLYQSYIREVVAIINSFDTSRQINIVGDCVSAVFSENKQEDNMVKDILQAASMIQGMMKVLNKKYKKKWGDIEEVRAGVGIAKGEALVLLAGLPYTDVKETIYMGEVVNQASKMCDLAYKDCTEAICVTEDIYLMSGIKANQRQTFQDMFRHHKKTYEGKVYHFATFYREEIADAIN